MRILFMGDVVGRTGRDTLGLQLPRLRAALRIDLAIVNAENASHGFGLSSLTWHCALFAAGADVITLGQSTPGIPQGDHSVHRPEPSRADPRAELLPARNARAAASS